MGVPGITRGGVPGLVVAGRYTLVESIGQGGMGRVWRAADEILDRQVAVKEMRIDGLDPEDTRTRRERTLREARATARIDHPHVVRIYDVVDEGERLWIVMELVDGRSLERLLFEEGPLDVRETARIGLELVDALGQVHAQGVLHRDIKPANVLVRRTGGRRVVLTDFGIAQVEGDPSITSTGMLVGAPSYISPERARGHKPGPAADLWSLGGLLYAAVEGVPPYDKGSAIATLTAVMTEPVPEPKCGGPLKDVIFGLLTKDPERRLDDAGARAMLNTVIHAPDPKDAAPLDATQLVPLPVVPQERPKKGGFGALGTKRGDEAGERPRAPRWSMRKGAPETGAAAAASAEPSTPGSASGAAARRTTGNTRGAAVSTPSAPPAKPTTPAKPAESATAVTTKSASVGLSSGAAGTAAAGAAKAGSASGKPVAGAVGARDGDTVAGGATSSGWPQVPPPDLPPRPVPRAPITDVVSRRTLAVIAVAVALVVLGTVLAFAFSGDGSADNSKGAGTKAVVSSGTSSDGAAKDEDKNGKDEDAGSVPSPDGETSEEATESDDSTDNSPSTDSDTSSGSGGSGGSGSSKDISAETYKSGQGFSIGLPDGWKYQSTGAAGARFAGPDGQKLLVGWTSTPKDDPVADWKNQEQYMTRAQYDRIRIEAVDYRGWNTADWEFTYVEGGTKYRSIDRGFVVDGQQGYALMYTAKASEWSGELRKNTWRTFTKTFRPKS
ncbi:serine/threonine-protein kinase [Streptomyces torulosus]|uniref:serine/threonine-protein kinase n=1 Tax=Streptomyces torulosus TaxID=68276 RepID=UPI0006EBC701|nr:serine/threonine-protein kinase [Streptomyces torulosus]